MANNVPLANIQQVLEFLRDGVGLKITEGSIEDQVVWTESETPTYLLSRPVVKQVVATITKPVFLGENYELRMVFHSKTGRRYQAVTVSIRDFRCDSRPRGIILLAALSIPAKDRCCYLLLLPDTEVQVIDSSEVRRPVADWMINDAYHDGRATHLSMIHDVMKALGQILQ